MAQGPDIEYFDVPLEQLHEALVAVVESHGRWKLRGDDGPGGAVRFNTGLSIWSWSGQDMVAATEPDGAGSKLTIGGRVARTGLGSIQLASWGEAGRIAAKLKQDVAARLPENT